MRDGITEINILIYVKSYHRHDHLICLPVVLVPGTTSLFFPLHFAVTNGFPLYYSPHLQCYRVVNHLRELSKGKEREELLDRDSANQWLLNND